LHGPGSFLFSSIISNRGSRGSLPLVAEGIYLYLLGMAQMISTPDFFIRSMVLITVL